ncbi:MAG: undecaprenyl-diphosphate phosphatase [Methylococcaceae bacterium]
MDLIILLKAFILGIVEGLTEFLPISSTGHLVLAEDLLHFNDMRGKLFAVVVQMGSILAVCWEYRAKLITTFIELPTQANARKFALNIAIAFLPLASIGFLFGHAIKDALFKPVPVALAFIIGGIIIIWAEKREHSMTITDVDQLTPLDALKLGCAQALALIPGTSRSGATIIGGLLFGLSRKATIEFSFFLAIPTLLMASLYDIYKHRELLEFASEAPYFLMGIITAFFSAILAIKALLRYISHNDFIIFAWYRIIFGVVVLVTAYSGLVQWTVE